MQGNVCSVCSRIHCQTAFEPLSSQTEQSSPLNKQLRARMIRSAWPVSASRVCSALTVCNHILLLQAFWSSKTRWKEHCICWTRFIGCSLFMLASDINTKYHACIHSTQFAGLDIFSEGFIRTRAIGEVCSLSAGWKCWPCFVEEWMCSGRSSRADVIPLQCAVYPG